MPRHRFLVALVCLPIAAPALAETPHQADVPIRFDALGDPLPLRAVARLGTTRWRLRQKVEAVAYSPDGTLLALAGHEGTVELLHAVTGQVINRLKCPHAGSGGHYCVAFSPDGRLLAVGPGPRLYEVATGKMRHWPAAKPDEKPIHLHGVAFSPDGKHLAGAGADDPGTVHVWETATGKHRDLGPSEALSVVPWNVAFSPDGKSLAAPGPRGKVHLWDTAAWRRRELSLGEDRAVSVAFSPDGTILAVGSDAKDICLLGLAAGTLTRRWPAHSFSVVAVAYSPDGKMLASSCLDRTTYLWEPATGDRLAEFHAESYLRPSLAF